MSKTKKWYARGLYLVFALALVVGLTFVPVTPADANVSKPTVTVEGNTAGLTGEYTINFNVGSAGPLVAGAGIIDIIFNDAYLTAPVSGDGYVTVNGALVTALKVAVGAWGGAGTSTVAITVPEDILAGSSVVIVCKSAFGIVNPVSGQYTLTVNTNAATDVTPVASYTYIIAGIPGKPATVYTSTGAFVNSYNKIQLAINGVTAAATGWTIEVSSDYNAASAGEAFPIVVDESVTIKSIDGAASTTIDATGTAGANVIEITAANVVLGGSGCGFTIKQKQPAGGAYDGAVIIKANKATIQGNIITGTLTRGIFAHPDDSAGVAFIMTIKDNTISSTTTTGTAGGIWVFLLPGSVIDNNDVSLCGAGISLYGYGAATSTWNTPITVSNNKCYSNPYEGIGLNSGFTKTKLLDHVIIRGNECYDNTFSGILMTGGTYPTTKLDEIIITGNTLYNNKWSGIHLAASVDDPTNVYVFGNNIYGNTSTVGTTTGNDYGIWNQAVANGTVPATHNWWGDASGPTVSTNPSGTGDKVTATYVTYEPWLGASVSAADYVDVGAAKSSLNAQSTVGVWLTSSQDADIGVAKYTGNPQETPEFSAIGYFEAYVANPTTGAWGVGDLVTIKLYDAAVTSSSKVYFWNADGNAWAECYDCGAAAGSHAWVYVRAYAAAYRDRVPVLTDLTGLPFAIGTPRALESIAATPASVSVDIAGTQALTVTATYNDATTADVTASSTYESDTPTVASVSTAGVITGVAAGSAIVTASYTEGTATKTDTVSVTVAGPADQLDDADIADETDMVYYFDNETKLWSYYAPGVPTSDLVTLITGSPCWIYVSADCTTTGGTVLYAGWNLIVWAG